MDLLPPPNLKRLLSGVKPCPALLAFCDFAEGYLEEQNPGGIPKKFRRSPRNKIIGGLWAELFVSLDFWARWMTTPKEEDTPDNFPRGLAVLVEDSRVDAMRAIEIIRTESWAQYVDEEYREAFERCQKSCAAVRLGHWPEPHVPLIFSTKDVEKVMGDCKRSVVGVVDYGHIYRVLLSQAAAPDSTSA